MKNIKIISLISILSLIVIISSIWIVSLYKEIEHKEAIIENCDTEIRAYKDKEWNDCQPVREGWKRTTYDLLCTRDSLIAERKLLRSLIKELYNK
ncbi:MAG: hypothetical protein LBG15_03835 [Dysgonamonadaceae bacterium]|jgi:hypothetical protein|nr:hypothetical protein [Dysgonamonadaceae bacterium]